MKKYINLTTVLISLLILLFFISLFPFGSKNYKVTKGTIKVPRMAFNTKKTNNTLIFISFRDYSMLTLEKDKILRGYQIITENNKYYYYDKKQNIILKKYQIKKGFLSNKIIIKYE